MVISLITPQGSNFIKDWPAQNAHNSDQIDNYAGPCLTSHPLQTYTPILKADTTDPVLGTGGLAGARGWYYEIWDQIYTWGEFRFGTSGISAGMGLYYVTLPFPVNNLLGYTNTPGTAPVVGSASTYDADNNATRLPMTCHIRAADQLFFGLRFNSGFAFRELRETGYVSWAINDGVSWFATYQRSP